ncbi:synaptonemal complex protein 1 [Sphaeramia orbicularis]|uniref:synaptonemal complex protein 1 n=1 Tax=Sphaeramia orbicularis TaxID=375764 RepID=UPI00117D4F1A|nr:synaptonemal complex protein 1 [Sphaeramia orbicularis]
MERDRGFSFKLLVPPRVNTGQVSAVRPQTYSKYFDQEKTMPLSTKSIVTPATKPNRQDCPKMKVVPPMEKDEEKCKPGQLYSKLFDEVEKIKCWKVKVDSDTVQKERKLQENKRTIETQRKAIQELQFGNESLSIKLEEQISENEDLINKNNAIQNLCNILKDTFERSAEKMHLFECEREETHHLFMENNESIQKLIEAFESLRIKAESDQHEVHKVKEGLQLQFEDLKEKYHQEYTMKEEEVEVLQTTLRAKENEIQKMLSDLHQTKEHFKTLEDGMKQQYEHLQRSNAENESLIQKLQNAEQQCKESERNQEAVAALLAQNKEEYVQIIQSKDLSLQEFKRIKNQQAVELEQMQRTTKELQKSLAAEIQRAKEFEDELVKNNIELERRNKLFGETIEQSARKEEQIKTLEEQLDIKSKSVQSMNGRVEELRAGLSKKTEETQELQVKMQELNEQFFNEKKQNEEKTFETEQLRKDIKHHKSKYEELLSSFNELHSVKNAIQQQFDSGSFNAKALEANMKVSEEKAAKLTKEIERLGEENQQLREEANTFKAIIHGKYQEIETLQMKMEDNWEHLQNEMTKKEKRIKAVETKLCNLKKKLETKLKSKEEYQKENKILKKQIAKEIANSHQQQNEINSLHEQTQNLKRLNEEDHQKLWKELESKSAFAAELENEVQKLRLTATEAIKNKEDSEIKCQYKITDMVTLMEKNKSQYDRMVEEKDAQLDEYKRKEMEAVAHGKSLELELLKHETENDCLKKQLSAEITEKEKLQKELTHLKEKESYMKIGQLSAAKNKSPLTQNQTSSKSYKSDISKTRKTPPYTDDDWSAAIMNKTVYRIRTPPSGDKSASLGKSTAVFDPSSDSSDQSDILIQSPITHRSPGKSLKQAAMKRMRDAGWTAVTGCDKKKKTREKIFA